MVSCLDCINNIANSLPKPATGDDPEILVTRIAMLALKNPNCLVNSRVVDGVCVHNAHQVVEVDDEKK